MTNYESYRVSLQTAIFQLTKMVAVTLKLYYIPQASLIASNKALIASLGIQKTERVPVKRIVKPDLYSHLGKRKSLKRAVKAEPKVYSSSRREFARRKRWWWF